MIIIGMDKELRKNPAYMLMFNLALADIGISTFVHTFTSVGNKLQKYKHLILSFTYYLDVP